MSPVRKIVPFGVPSLALAVWLAALPPSWAMAHEDGERDARHRAAPWFGYMSDWVFHPKWSIWFDSHYNVEAFFVLRFGLTHTFAAGPRLTAGYARLWTDPGNGSLSRNEHRPWAQVVFPFRLTDEWSFSQRLRYDMRFRENIADGETTDGYTMVNRARFQMALTYWLPELPTGQFFLQAADEVLVDFGQNAGPNYLNQNRLSFLVGIRIETLTLRVGYMNRFIPGRTGLEPIDEHAILFWVNQTIRFGKGLPVDSAPEGSNP